MNHVQALPRTRRRRRWPSDRKLFLIGYLLFCLDQMTWISYLAFVKHRWVILGVLLFWGWLYRLQITQYEAAKAFEERHQMPYPPLRRWQWLALGLMYLVAALEWISWPW